MLENLQSLREVLTSPAELQDYWLTLPMGTSLLNLLRPRRLRHVTYLHNHDI